MDIRTFFTYLHSTRHRRGFHLRMRVAAIAAAAVPLLMITAATHACSIFVLTDANRTLFCNSEDWKEPNHQIWFVPAGDGRFGAAYVGLDNGWGYAQGGLNTEGLAFDWVAGSAEKWEPDPKLATVRYNSGQEMLETCATVDEAIAYYRSHHDRGFSYAKILVADKSGASVIIGAKDGKLQIEKEKQSRGFGYAGEILKKISVTEPEPTVANGADILRSCQQPGEYATKYSNIFDLKSGDIFLYQFSDNKKEVKLNLNEELGKGAHYYALPEIEQQLSQSPKPLNHSMKPR